MPLCLAACLFALLPLPLWAGGYAPVQDRAAFVDLVSGRNLKIALYGLALQVHPDGRITGAALGQAVSGQWDWRDGFFCREMTWGRRAIPANCQLVELREGREMRFTTDRGAGQSAVFRLD